MPAWVIAAIEAIAYGAARGYWRAYFDVMTQGQRATEEPTNDADAARLALFRRAVADAAGVPAPGASDGGGKP